MYAEREKNPIRRPKSQKDMRNKERFKVKEKYHIILF